MVRVTHTSPAARRHRVAAYLFAGFLSFACAELFAGSSPLWPVRPWAWLVTIPLYSAHLWLLVTIARLTGRTSLTALYLFGVLFGLYESWITKVVWAGYGGHHAVGAVGGFGVHETLALVFVYHPVASLMLPVAVLAHLSPGFRAGLGGVGWAFAPRRRPWWMFGLAALIVVLPAFNLRTPIVIAVTWAATLVAGGLLLRMARPALADEVFMGDVFLRRGRILIVAAAMLAFYYIVGYFGLDADRRPSLVVQLVTLAAYPLIVLLIRRTPVIRARVDGEASADVDAHVEGGRTESDAWNARWWWSRAAWLGVAAAALSLVPPVTYVLFVVCALALIVGGVVAITAAIRSAIRSPVR